jgi:hypothetical protein
MRLTATRRLLGTGLAASMTVAGLAVFTPAADAITGCPSGSGGHCYAIGRMGENSTGRFVPINAIGGDLYLTCIGGINENVDFVNYETWLDTNLNIAGVGAYWVEEGMKLGIGVFGQNHGFQWFWADNRPNGGGYNEHYFGRPAYLQQFHNVTFRWLGGPNWNVLLDGGVVGESVNNGAFAGGSDTGVETTTGGARFNGSTRWWQYADPSWNWHNVSAAGDGHLTSAPLNSPVVILPASPGDIVFATGEGGNSCAPGTLGSVKMAQRFTGPASFAALARHASLVNGDSAPRNVQYVKTTRSRAAAFTGGRAAKDGPVYVIQLHGHFNGAYASVPPGHKRPSGTIMTIVVDAASGLVTDAGISDASPGLSVLGRPRALNVTP